MRLATIALFVIFACSACASRAKSARALQNNHQKLSRRAWSMKQSSSTHSLLAPESESCNPYAVIEAWKNKVNPTIDFWPDADEAYSTTFEMVPAVITKNTVYLRAKKTLQNQLDAFMATDQLLGYATLTNGLKTTYYIVRVRMGDTMREAQAHGLNYPGMLELIVKANELYEFKCGMDLSHCGGDNYGYNYVFEKGENNKYVQAHRISFKGAKPMEGKYKMLTTLTTERHYCVEQWKTKPQ